MNARDIMTTPVVSISPDTRLAHVAARRAEHRISGLPVVDRGFVPGIVSEFVGLDRGHGRRWDRDCTDRVYRRRLG